jgi:hypothetical protein
VQRAAGGNAGTSASEGAPDSRWPVSQVYVTMLSNRRFSTEEEHLIIDIQDGRRLYEILNAAGDGLNENRWFEYRSSK